MGRYGEIWRLRDDRVELEALEEPGDLEEGEGGGVNSVSSHL